MRRTQAALRGEAGVVEQGTFRSAPTTGLGEGYDVPAGAAAPNENPVGCCTTDTERAVAVR